MHVALQFIEVVATILCLGSLCLLWRYAKARVSVNASIALNREQREYCRESARSLGFIEGRNIQWEEIVLAHDRKIKECEDDLFWMFHLYFHAWDKAEKIRSRAEAYSKVSGATLAISYLIRVIVLGE